jgi:uncharacterized protein (TIGR00156 family)
MNKLIFAVCFSLLLVFTANAQSGYKGPGPSQLSVAEAKKLRDDSPVTLRGNIVRSLGAEKYVFSDHSGSITVDIDNKIWIDLEIDENDLVEISGEIDRERKIEVDVKSIRKM